MIDFVVLDGDGKQLSPSTPIGDADSYPPLEVFAAVIGEMELLMETEADKATRP
jgi:hypothetical protein